MAQKFEVIQPGVLNEINLNSKTIPFNSVYDSSIEHTRKIVREISNPNSFDNAGHFIGQVLYVKSPLAGLDPPAVASQMSAIQTTTVHTDLKLCQVIVRIPELHAFMHYPRDSDDLDAISLYPIFTAINDSVAIPNIGDLIVVDFKNKANRTDGIFITKIKDSGVSPGLNGVPGALGAWGRGLPPKTSFAPNLASNLISKDPTKKMSRVWMWTNGGAIGNTKTSAAKYIQMCKDVNATDIVLFLNNNVTKDRFKPFPNAKNPATCAGFVKQYSAAGLRVHIMTWISALGTYAKDAGTLLNAICKLSPVATAQLDAEEPWGLGSDADRQKAANEFSAAFNRIRPLGVNTIVSHSPTRLQPLFNIADYIVPQAYSLGVTNLREGGIITKPDSTYAPGRTQTAAMKNFSRYNKPLIMGLGAWHQDYVGLDTNDAMKICIDTSANLGITEVIYWNVEWTKYNKTIRNFIKNINTPTAPTVVPPSVTAVVK